MRIKSALKRCLRCLTCRSGLSLGTPSHTPASMPTKRVLVVGDVHALWSKTDEAAAKFLKPDVVVFVGDFGEEDVELVQEIAGFNHTKAVILGNHDAWNVGRRNKSSIKGVEAQLAALGAIHVGYGQLEVEGIELTVVGARPFSWGGDGFRGTLPLLQQLYGVNSMGESCKRIVKVVKQVPTHHDVVLIGHNGPKGLGDKAHDLCGVDFKMEQGDLGDSDMRDALEDLKEAGRHVALVTFGHMHEELGRFPGRRRRVQVDPSSGSVFLNAAVVPRLRHVLDSKDTLHHFCLVDIQDHLVTVAKDVWVRANHSGDDTAPTCSIGYERALLKRAQNTDLGSTPEQQVGSKSITWDILDAHTDEWGTVTAQIKTSSSPLREQQRPHDCVA